MAPVDLRLTATISGEREGPNVAALCRGERRLRETFQNWRARFALEGIAGSSSRPEGVAELDRLLDELADSYNPAGPT